MIILLMPPVAMVRSFVLIAFMFANLICDAQSDARVSRYSVQHFGEEEGVPNSIYSILPVKNEFLWVATSNGVFRFNGNKILPVYIKGTEYKKRFINVTSLHYKGTDTILAFSAFLGKVAVIVNNKIVQVKEENIDETGFLFLNQPNPVKAPPYIAGNMHESEFAKAAKWNIGLSFLHEGGIYSKDVIWIVLNDGIGFYNKSGLISKIKIPGVQVNKIVCTGSFIFYLDKNNYLNCYTIEGLKKRILITPSKKHELVILNNRFGKGFYYITDSSLYKAEISAAGNLQVNQIISGLRFPSRISAIFEKDSNTIVTATFENGLYIYRKIFLEVSKPLPNATPNTFFAQCLLPDGKTIFTGKGCLFENGLQYTQKLKGYDNKSYGIITDHNGFYWYGISGCILRSIRLGATADTVLRIKGIYPEIFLEDKNGRIWFASESEFGYIQNNKFTAVYIKALANKRINCMRQDASGKYFIGTDSGLFTYDDNDGYRVKEISNFTGLHVRNILLKPDGLIWILTYGNGFFLMDKDNVTSISNKTEKLAFIHTLIEDEQGYCWLPSNNGLFVATKQSLTTYAKDKITHPFFYMFSVKDGLRTNEFTGGTEPPYIRLQNGDISLTSMDGLVHFNPSKAYFYFSASPILIDEVKLDSSEIEEFDSLKINNNVKNIRISVSTSYWGNKENTSLEYQVIAKAAKVKEGQWVEVNESGKINLFSLSHGNYQLILRKRNGFGKYDYITKVINFQVLPEWYHTKTFEALKVCCIIIALTGIYFWRKRYYKRYNDMLKEKVNRATLKLQQLNNSLEKKIEERTHAIKEAEKKFRTLVEESLVGVCVIQNNKYVYLNPRFEKILGYEPGELVDKSIFTVISKRNRSAFIERAIPHATGKIDTQHYELEAIKKDGTICQLEFLGTYVIYEGKPAIIGTMLDVTEKKKLEQEKINRKNEEQKIEIRAILLGEERERNKIGQELHDNINQILFSTKLYLSVAQKRSGEGEKTFINDSIKLIDNAIEEIRALSNNKVAPAKSVSLQEMLQLLLIRMSANSNIKMKMNFKVPTLLVNDDLKLNIYRIVQEQLNNILKHAQAKRVKLVVKESGSNIHVSIADDGEGFDTSTKKDGIGISNMTNRVKSFNGTIAIKSQPGNGCTITITLPSNSIIT